MDNNNAISALTSASARTENRNIELVWVKASELRANPKNWREHPPSQAGALNFALKKVRWAGAALYNERTQRLIDGHLRAELSGDAEIPVLVGNWSEEDERFILATLDPIAAMARANAEKVNELTALVAADPQNAPMADVFMLLSKMAEEGAKALAETPPIFQPDTALGNAFADGKQFERNGVRIVIKVPSAIAENNDLRAAVTELCKRFNLQFKFLAA